MSTRSGRSYRAKPRDTMSEELKQALQALIEDRTKREEEITAERAAREKEIEAERSKREEERVAREREVKERMDAMEAHLGTLMKLLEAKTKEEPKTTELSGVKLVPLSEKDDIEAYLVTFERIMEAHKVDPSRWPHYLTPQLSGKAQLAFAALPTEDSGNYEKIKTAILQRYDINEESYRRRFRSAARNEGESNRELAVRMMDWQGKWLRECKSMEEIREAVGKEQFLNSLPMDKRLWVVERKPKTCIEAGELADEYEQVRKQDGSMGSKLSMEKTGITCRYCGKLGHIEKECRKKKMDTSQCHNCKKFGHHAKHCPGRALVCLPGTHAANVFRSGRVEGRHVTDILLDTGCSRTMVHKNLVPDEKVKEGEAVTIRCAHGDTCLYPLADVQLEVDGLDLTVEAAVSETLPTIFSFAGDRCDRASNPSGY